MLGNSKSATRSLAMGLRRPSFLSFSAGIFKADVAITVASGFIQVVHYPATYCTTLLHEFSAGVEIALVVLLKIDIFRRSLVKTNFIN